MKRRLQGFSLVELSLSMALSLSILALVLSALVTGRKSALQSEAIVQLQHQAQLAHHLIQVELQNLWFLAGVSWANLTSETQGLTSPTSECAFSGQAGSFPSEGLLFLPIFAMPVEGPSPSCLPGVNTGTDVLQIRRLEGVAVKSAQMVRNKVYFEPQPQHTQARFVHSGFTGITGNVWPYHHVVYYIQSQNWLGQSLPVLMRKRLVRSQSGQLSMSAESVLDGVEKLFIELGLDLNSDGQLDEWFRSDQMTLQLWQQPIVALRYHLLVRTLQAEAGYQNHQRYLMGQREYQAPGDGYRRLHIASAVFISNSRL